MSFGGKIHKEIAKKILEKLPKRDQNQVFQHLYDTGYTVPEIANATDIPAPTLYNRIDAHRGRKGVNLSERSDSYSDFN